MRKWKSFNIEWLKRSLLVGLGIDDAANTDGKERFAANVKKKRFHM
jgi:hypothetical protein